MRLPFHLLSLVATIITNPLVSASSAIRSPLGAVTTLQNATIHTHNGRLTHVSEFDLTFNIHDELHVKLRLEPNHDIVGEGATVTYLNQDGSIRHTEGIDRAQHRVYKGTTFIQRLGHEEETWKNVGWARITVTRDGRQPVFGGAFKVDRDHHHIQTSTNYQRTKHALDPEVVRANGEEEFMVVWRDSDIGKTPLGLHQDLRRDVDGQASECSSDELNFNSQPDHPVYMAMKSKRSEKLSRFMDPAYIFKRQDIDGTTVGNSAGVDLKSTIGSTAGCPSTRKVALLGIATDCTYAQDFGGDTQKARENVLDMMNSASAIYERTFNISLGLQNLNVLPPECPGTPASGTEWNQACSSSVDISERLNLFSAWRGNQKDSNSYWTLLSTCNTGSAVGLAWLGQLCVGTAITTNGSVTGDGSTNGGSETVTGANVVVRTNGASEWQVMAHETGHTFGAVHDCTDSSCQNQQFVDSQQCCPFSAQGCSAGGSYIMNPSTTPGIEDFSPCSIGNICSALNRNSVDGSCLTSNRNVNLVTGQQCGNGIVEEGEDCDCGGEVGCAGDTCCNPTTCKFTTGSVCDDANEDCCRNCQFATAQTVCRASTGQCDPEETCPGNAGTCPADNTTEDGTKCGDGLSCASGQCTSRDMQCKTVMGSYTQGNDTYACQSSGCALSCASPEFGRGVCYRLQQNFLDGTSCGGGGRCNNGQCKGSTVGGSVRSWIDDNKTIVIAVASAVGGILVLAILSCILSRCRRRRGRRTAQRGPGGAPIPPPMGHTGGWNGPPPPNMAQQNSSPNFYAPSHPSQGWASQSFAPPTSPPPPPPAYQQHGSTRYA
ncbi:uncharacterized protein MYCGRDRAFT_67183 [Zymoseptoria tritici IPO323]|uniref:Disintegrin and metalloproteinase domain-containing protein B n=1 Tax=Zymoseptoria tritici (strain CBS 115943 / IPO323) TaxID=336722 RepID=F9WYH9_ZYMTI|nr:uncharacterized protein MYCGRDRAFT_67183 [Zymoseptoria tritici IPO323]EGP91629.1 hypothetical protein MYCGRDRAFT_67183 [Zymoseptoria tritici IPO323]